MRSYLQLAISINYQSLTIILAALFGLIAAPAYAAPSVPYMPTWQARHHLERLVDEAGLEITTTHWPLPLVAVQHALDELSNDLSPALLESKEFITEEIQKLIGQGKVDAQFRIRAEAPVGFSENYTPGSSIKVSSSAIESWSNNPQFATRIGVRIEESPNSLQTSFSGWCKESRIQPKLDETAIVTQISGTNIQAFARQNWWGPGWQTSLINGVNIPPWMGVGIQRSEVKPSESKWLSLMGPWSFEMFVAKAQDPIVVENQPDGFYFIGTRLTLKPSSWIEIGLSRGTQVGGTGRQSGIVDILKAAFTGGSTHTFTGNTQEDMSNSVGGYDVRLNCPKGVRCAFYFQWMGEDASGQSHLPNQFMTLAGADWWSATGRHRVFYEFAQTYASSFPWNDSFILGSSYRNWAYPQGYTNGGRWIGASFGGDAGIFTVGWLDAKDSRLMKIYAGEIRTSVGSYDPKISNSSNSIAPHGRLVGFGFQQRMAWDAWAVVPEFSYTKLSKGQAIGVNRIEKLRWGITFSKPFGD